KRSAAAKVQTQPNASGRLFLDIVQHGLGGVCFRAEVQIRKEGADVRGANGGQQTAVFQIGIAAGHFACLVDNAGHVGVTWNGRLLKDIDEGTTLGRVDLNERPDDDRQDHEQAQADVGFHV